MFALPTIPRLRNERLQAEVARIEKELAEHNAAASAYGLSLQSDGKDNTARRHLVNIITTTPLGPEFRDVVDVSGHLRDAANSAQLLVDAVGRLSAAEASNLVSIVTDTPAVNRRVWKIIEQTLPRVHCVPCAAHCLNLHFRHVFQGIPEFKRMVDNSNEIVKRFSNTDFARHMLRVQTPKFTISQRFPQGRKLELYKPGATRFAPNFRMIDRLLELKGALQQVAFSADYKETCASKKNNCPVTKLLGSADYWAEAEAWREALAPVYLFLRSVDTWKPSMHLIVKQSSAVRIHYESSTFTHAPQLLAIWLKDWKYMHSPLHSAAYLLDPSNRSSR